MTSGLTHKAGKRQTAHSEPRNRAQRIAHSEPRNREPEQTKHQPGQPRQCPSPKVPSSASHYPPRWCSHLKSSSAQTTSHVSRGSRLGSCFSEIAQPSPSNRKRRNPAHPHQSHVGEHRPQLEQGPDRQPRPPHHIERSPQTPNANAKCKRQCKRQMQTLRTLVPREFEL